MYLKNDSSPNAIYAILVNASDGAPITSGVAVYHIQGTTRSAGQGTLTHIANGRWAYVPTQAETNYDAFAIDFYHASAVGQGVLVEIVTANQGLAVITADTSAIKQKTDAYLDATISSRAPANTALSNTVWTNEKASYLDVAISSRLAASAYTPPDNAAISSIKNTVDTKLDATISSRAPANTALSNTVWTDAKADFLDAAISSRLEASSYVAPDNASISAIKTQTDKFQFDSNNYVYAVGIGGGSGTDWTDTEKQQIRYRLGIDGASEQPSATPSLSTLNAQQVWEYETRTLSAFGFNVTVGDYAEGLSPGEQIEEIGYTQERAQRLDNLDAAITTRLAADDYVAPDNQAISEIKQQTDKLNFTGESGSEFVLASATVDVDEEAIAEAIVGQIQNQNLVQVVVRCGARPIDRCERPGSSKMRTFSGTMCALSSTKDYRACWPHSQDQKSIFNCRAAIASYN